MKTATTKKSEMTDIEIDENEFFHQDFTTASKWEVFNSNLEELFHEWKLPYSKPQPKLRRNELYENSWIVQKETLNFAEAEFEVYHYKISTVGEQHFEESLGCQTFRDIINGDNEFCLLDESDEKVHRIAQWYGLREFIVIVPVQNIFNESQIKVLLSSMHIAVADSNCEVPVFVQVLKKNQNVYLGVCESHSTRLSFNVIHLATVPPTCRYLSDILDIFLGKVEVPYIEPVTVSVRFTYKLQKFVSTAYKSDSRKSFMLEDFANEESFNEIYKNRILPFGTSLDPVKELIVNCTWSRIAHNVVMDSQSYSDFDPILAPIWSIRAKFEMNPICYASECIADYLYQSENRAALSEYYPHIVINVSNDAKVLDKIAESKIASLLPLVLPPTGNFKSKEIGRLDGPILDSKMMTMLYYLFPDAQIVPQNMYNNPLSGPFDAYKIKSAIPDSLPHRLSILLAITNAHYGGPRAMAQLWAEFIQEMRYRVDKNVQIPGVGGGFPDSRTCLLHQKLQMLNICMERKRIREGGLPFAMTSISKNSSASSITDSQLKDYDSDDEFFDCNEVDESATGKHDPKHAAWNQPIGRLSKLGKMLLVNSDEPLFIPVTQEPVAKTEDQLEDDAEVMLKLGSSSELRAQMMSASLFSDMESFKAANPAAVLEDFIRWYSPRDWIEEDCNERDPFCRKGHLSERMLIPGNAWQTTWDKARPVPAHRQRRLFDDTKEAEKVLHFLESTTIGQICQMTITCLFHAVIVQVNEEGSEFEDIIPDWKDNFQKVVQMCCKLSRDSWNNPNTRGNSRDNWTLLLNEITNLEYSIIQAKSLLMKIAPDFEKKMMKEDKREEESRVSRKVKKVLASLLKSLDTDLKTGSKHNISLNILNLFGELKQVQAEHKYEQTDDSGVLPNPFEKQFILRQSGKLATKDIGGPQFLRAIIRNDEMRLCGAFSQDTTYI